MEFELINKTIENINAQHPFKVEMYQNGIYDGELLFNIKGGKMVFNAILKKEFRMHQLTNILYHKGHHKNLMVIAEKIFPNVKRELRKNKIAYAESNGNIYIETDKIYVYVDTNKENKIKIEKGNRAFTKTGLKVLFNFLTDAALVNQTQRQIAERTGVALGNIPQIINGLIVTGYLLRLNKKELVWEKREELLERWITEYETVLRPQLKKGKYRLKVNWQQVQFNPDKTVWGGEPAADLLTHHLRPEKFKLYTKENQLNLMKNYRLIPDQNGELEVFEMFWKNEINKNTAPPLLVYADLLAEGGKRNKETAEIIYNEYIQPNL
jgi:hypothetical protein